MTIAFAAKLTDPGPRVVLRSGEGDRQVSWGHPWQIGTAAYWVEATREAFGEPRQAGVHRLGETLEEELAACIIGGFGMPFETGLAAYSALRTEVLHHVASPTQEEIEAVLRRPLLVNGSHRRYRFPAQRARRLASALAFVRDTDCNSMSNREMREWLLGAPGVGMKTASWVVRNIRAADDLAVLDIHVMRAGIRAGVFPEDFSPQRNYRVLEGWFVEWARIGGVSPADLDAYIWRDQAYWVRNR